MKTALPLLICLLLCMTANAQPAPVPPQPQAAPTAQPASAPKDTANYIITVKWADPKHQTNSIQLLTAEGTFTLDTIQGSVRIDDNDIPTTVSVTGTITPVNSQKGTLKLFLGRTVPYVTSTYSPGGGKSSSSYQQMRVGLNATFTVRFGSPVVIQSDENGEVSIVVKREEI